MTSVCNNSRDMLVRDAPQRTPADGGSGDDSNHDIVDGYTVDKVTRMQTPWLYQCMISECMAPFERLTDLKMHFVDKHQSGMVAVPCCFCMKEFATWTSAVTAHIASHVHIKSIRCLECRLSFATKEMLMYHLHSCHSKLPEGICIDVTIDNHERRASHRKSSGSWLPEPVLSGNAVYIEKQMDCVERAEVNENRQKNDESCLNGHVDADDQYSKSSWEKSDTASVSCTDDEARDSTGSSASRTCRRKPRKPSHVVIEDPQWSKMVCEDDCDWVEIVAATRPMVAQCRHCTFTCNTELQLKIHVYECHEKPRGSQRLASRAQFYCRLCGADTNSFVTHCNHLAHHRSLSSELIRVVNCVFCDCRSDSIEFLKEHVSSHHHGSEMRFKIQQSRVSYLQGMMTCPVCSGAFSWKEDLLHHFGAVHHLEELIAHLEAEYTSEACPPCCRVPRVLFKNLLPESKGSGQVTAKASHQPANLAAEENCSHMVELEDIDTTETTVLHSNGQQLTTAASTSKPRRRSSGNPTKSIERYHCDSCEFSANDFHHLMEHSKEHLSEKPSSPSKPVQVLPAAREETEHDHTYLSRRQVRPVPDTLVCDFCPFSTTQQHVLRRHMDTHKDPASVEFGYRCSYCEFSSPAEECVSGHCRTRHPFKPVKILRIVAGKVVKTIARTKTRTKPISSLSSGHVAKKRTNLLRPKSNFAAIKRSMSTSRKPAQSNQARAAASLDAAKWSGSSREELTKALESKLPLQMIYSTPVQCPVCEFRDRARKNLVRHIRSAHSGSQQSESRPPECCSTPTSSINCGDRMSLSLEMDSTLLRLSVKADAVGVFLPSLNESFVEQCLDMQHSYHVSELASNISHYPTAMQSTSVSNLERRLIDNNPLSKSAPARSRNCKRKS